MPAKGPPPPTPPPSREELRMSSHLAQSTPLGRPLRWSGQTPIVVPVRKLGGCWVAYVETALVVSSGLTTVELGDGLVPGEGMLVDDSGVVVEEALETGLLRVRSRTQSKPLSAVLRATLQLVEAVALVFVLVLQLLLGGLVDVVKLGEVVLAVLEKLDGLHSVFERLLLILQLRETGCVSGTCKFDDEIDNGEEMRRCITKLSATCLSLTSEAHVGEVEEPQPSMVFLIAALQLLLLELLILGTLGELLSEPNLDEEGDNVDEMEERMDDVVAAS